MLKHMHDLSDEVLCARWLENPYYQFFCGEVSFCHKLPFERSSLTHWRQRLGEEHLIAPGSGEPIGGAQDRGFGDSGSRTRGGRHDGSTKGDRTSDRCPVMPPRAGEAGRSRRTQRSAVAAELSPGGQARGDHDRSVQPCPPV